MISQYLRRQPTVRRDLSAAREYSSTVFFRILMWFVGIGAPLYFGGHVLAWWLKQVP